MNEYCWPAWLCHFALSSSAWPRCPPGHHLTSSSAPSAPAVNQPRRQHGARTNLSSGPVGGLGSGYPVSSRLGIGEWTWALSAGGAQREHAAAWLHHASWSAIPVKSHLGAVA